MKILINLPALGLNNYKVTSKAEEVHEVLDTFYVIMTRLFPSCCVDCAITDLAVEIEEAAMEILEGDEDDLYYD